MNLAFERLALNLRNNLSNMYVISGDEPLLMQETCDLVRSSVYQQGFTERQIFTVERGFNFADFKSALIERSLFSSKRLLEMRIPNGKPGNDGAQILTDYVANPAPDVILLVILPKLDAATKNTKWLKTLTTAKNCQLVQIWPINQRELPNWLTMRCNNMGLKITPEAIELIAVKTQGNLLACVQELTKLQLLFDDKPVDISMAQNAITDSSRYSVFDLTDCVLLGNFAQINNIMLSLKAENIEPILILWALMRELRILITLSSSPNLENALNNLKPRPNPMRQNILTKALRRYKSHELTEMLLKGQQIDEQIKGQKFGDVWQELITLSLNLAGKPLNLTKNLAL